jgi:hypothetical protein
MAFGQAMVDSAYGLPIPVPDAFNTAAEGMAKLCSFRSP